MSAPPDARSDPPARPAIVTDSTPYLPRALIDRWRIQQVSLYVGWDGDLRRESDYEDLDAFYAQLHDSPRLPTTSQPSAGDFLACYEPLVSAGRDVLSIHLAGGLSGTCESAREAARLLSRGRPSGTRRGARQPDRRGRPRLPGRARRRSRRTGRAPAGARRCAPQGTREPGHLVLPGHAGVPAARRADRRRAGDARNGAEAQADPHVRHRDRPGRARAHAPAGVRANGRLPRRSARARRDRLDRAARPGPADAERLVEQGRAIFGFDPLFCTQVGPCWAPTSGRGCWSGA